MFRNASMIGGLQTQEALKLIHGMPVASGEAMIFNGIANRFYNTRFQHKEDCLSHETYPEPVELPLSAADNTADRCGSASVRRTGSARDPRKPNPCSLRGTRRWCPRLANRLPFSDSRRGREKRTPDANR